VGYSSKLEVDEGRNSDLATRSIGIFKSLVENYGGKVANVSGDGVLALFDSAEQTLRFAIEIQTDFRERAVWGDGEPIGLRIGINLGEVISTGDAVSGHCINVAVRLQALAEPGSIVVTDDVRRAARGIPRTSFQSLGRPALKNISEHIEVYSVTSSSYNRAGSAPVAARYEAKPIMAAQECNPVVAVLPLTNLTNDPATEPLGLAIVDGVIADLSRFRLINVIASHSASLFSLKALSAREIGRRLGAQYLLAGSINRLDKRVRIAVELIDAETESLVWSERFNINIVELFDLQDEITGGVASRLAVQIEFAEHHRSQRPTNIRSYGLVLRGHALILTYVKEANTHARQLLKEALDIAPGYARVHSVMSRSHNFDWRYTWSRNPGKSLDTAVKLAQRAVGLDHLDARGFAELGYANLYRKHHEESLAGYERALALNPNDADVIADYADALVYSGQAEQALPHLERAMRLNPFYPDWYLWHVADAYNSLKRPADVIATIHRMHDQGQGRRLLAANFAHLGMMVEARAEAEEVMRLYPKFRISQWRHRPPYRHPELLERFVDGLRRAGLPD
jgi:TolB-like protein